MARVYVAGGWYDAGTIDCTAATHKGMTIQFGGGPHPQDWYGTLDAVADGRLDPSPSIGRTIGLDEVPDAIDQVRKGQGPPRVVVHPTRIMTVLPGPIRQIGYVVTDLDRAIDELARARRRSVVRHARPADARALPRRTV